MISWPILKPLFPIQFIEIIIIKISKSNVSKNYLELKMRVIKGKEVLYKTWTL